MIRAKTMLLASAMIAAIAAAAAAQPRESAPPAGPFKAVHLLTLTAEQEARYAAAIKDFNQVFAKQGCAACAYHLYKTGGPAGAKYDHLQISDWPGRDMYVKIHASEDFKAAGKRNPIMDDVARSEFYGRFTEVK